MSRVLLDAVPQWTEPYFDPNSGRLSTELTRQLSRRSRVTDATITVRVRRTVVITLSSDFGSPYPAAMKGVISSQTSARLVDVSHDLPRQDVRSAAFWMREILPYFPPAVHLVVVDPGVGTDRDALLVRAAEHVLIGPDNGVLRPVVRVLADGGPVEWYQVDDADAASTTFHGRDVFAPAAATAHGTPIDELSTIDAVRPVADPIDLELQTATVDGDVAAGTVLAVDDFGNCITNVPGSFVDGHEELLVDGTRVPIGSTFSAVSPGEAVAVVGSHGNVELDVNRGRGEALFELDAGDSVTLERRR